MPVSWNLLPDALLLVGADDRVVEANRAAGALFGTDVSALRGRRVGSLLSRDLSKLAFDTLVRDRISRADGTPVPVDLLSVPAGSQRLLVVRKMPQERLLDEMRATLDVAFDSTPLCAALFNSEGQYIRVNDNLCRLLGRAPDGLLGRRDQEFTHPEDRPADLEAAWRILRGELDIWQTEKRFLRPDGSVVWVIANLTFLRDERGGPLGWLGQFQDITGRRETEAQLRERERQLAEAQHVAHVGSFVWDIPADRLEWSDELCRLFGRRPGHPPANHAEYLASLHPDDRELAREAIAEACTGRGAYAFEHRAVWPDGSERLLQCLGKVQFDAHGQAARVLGTAQDVTDARRVERSLQENERLLRAGFDGAAIGMALVAPDGRCIRVNRALCALTGYSEHQLLGASFGSISHPEDVERVDELIVRTLAGEISSYQVEKRYVRASGELVWVHLSVSLVRDESGEPLYFVSQVQEIGQRKRYEAELERLAAQDPLTGLLNQRVFRDQLRSEVARAARHGRPLSVVLLDLDHFKLVNDRHGHPVGDQVLTELGRRLQGLVRHGEPLARVGGEEFAWILPDTAGPDAYTAVERARAAISAVPFPNVGSLTMSAGICELAYAQDAEQLYAQADKALYWAKRHGRNQTFSYNAETAVYLAAATSEPASSSLAA